MKCLVFAWLALGACTPDVDPLPVQANGAPTVFLGTIPGPDGNERPDSPPAFVDAGVFAGDGGPRLFDAINYGDVGQNPYDASRYADAQIPPFP